VASHPVTARSRGNYGDKSEGSVIEWARTAELLPAANVY